MKSWNAIFKKKNHSTPTKKKTTNVFMQHNSLFNLLVKNLQIEAEEKYKQSDPRKKKKLKKTNNNSNPFFKKHNKMI